MLVLAEQVLLVILLVVEQPMLVVEVVEHTKVMVTLAEQVGVEQVGAILQAT
jgi:hypothetical protein